MRQHRDGWHRALVGQKGNQQVGIGRAFDEQRGGGQGVERGQHAAGAAGAVVPDGEEMELGHRTSWITESYTFGMKTAISLTDELFEAVETNAKKLGVSRSQFFAMGAEKLIRQLEAEEITAAYNRVYSAEYGEDPETAEFRKEAARRSFERTEW